MYIEEQNCPRYLRKGVLCADFGRASASDDNPEHIIEAEDDYSDLYKSAYDRFFAELITWVLLFRSAQMYLHIPWKLRVVSESKFTGT